MRVAAKPTLRATAIASAIGVAVMVALSLGLAGLAFIQTKPPTQITSR
jgi:hypothetical protein